MSLSDKLGMVHCVHTMYQGITCMKYANYAVFLSLQIIFISANSEEPDECCILYFIWVFTVCQSIDLPVSSIQRDNSMGESLNFPKS